MSRAPWVEAARLANEAQFGPSVGWEPGPERRCATCGAPWVPIPGRHGVTGCRDHPDRHHTLEDVWQTTAPPAEQPRPASDQALVALEALRQASETLLDALQRADGVLRQELAQDGPPSALGTLQMRVHNLTDALQGDLPAASQPIPVKMALQALIRHCQEANR